MIITFDKDTVLEFPVQAPLFVPFHCCGGADGYYKYGAFDLDPFHLYADATSGSPVVLTERAFFGFMNESGGRFSYNGQGVLRITCPAGQSLCYNEDCNPYDQWKLYNEEVLKDQPAHENQDFWGGLEYCTWVEQKKEATLRGEKENQFTLCADFVYDYMRRVDKLGMPKGKLTIDDGWDLRFLPQDKRVYGNWTVDRAKFPEMEKLVKDMKDEGFIPGLWFAPFTFSPNCELALRHPELIGDIWNGNYKYKWGFIRPDPVLEDYYREIFSVYVGMGFKKFKLDIAYGVKSEMKQMLAMMYKIIKELDPTVEVECHIPDIFVSRYCDTVRMNDVGFEQDWRKVTIEHYRVCRYSSHDRILNLDHLGTNTPISDVEDYLEHTKMLLALEGGYPCVSLLPDYFGKAASDIFAGCIREWYEQHENSKRRK